MNFAPYAFTAATALVLTLVFMPMAHRIAFKVNLLDKPNSRKVHGLPVPLVGGMTVFAAYLLAFVLAVPNWMQLGEIRVLLTGATVLVLVGIIDDKMDIPAHFKLLIQIALSYYSFINGFRLESLHGVLGLYELPLIMQYLLTLVIVTGVINAFNLMDGIDGLAASLGILGLLAFAYAAFLVQNPVLLFLFFALVGALLGFLRFNFSCTQKVFMGDAGSLFLGFTLVMSSLSMIHSAQGTANIKTVLAIVIGVLALPVIDSLRVYRRRIKSGSSPLLADRSHSHHLVLKLGLQHLFSSVLIVAITSCLILLSIAFGNLFGITISLVVVVLFFSLTTKLLVLNSDVDFWRERIKQLENT